MYWKTLSNWKILVSLLLAAGGVYWVWANYFAYDNYDALLDFQKEYAAAMTADTYGGKTPQETLDLFVKALRAGDVELAAKYFALDDKLSREKWVYFISGIKIENKLESMIRDLSTAQFYKSISNESQQFVIYNKDKTDSLIIDLKLNKYSSVWKIESL